MTKIPDPIDTVESRIDAYHKQKNLETPPTRYHMGISQLGCDDEAAMWLNFRWAFKTIIPGRVLRLFRRGHREEETVVADLQAAGMVVRDYGDNQRFLSFGKHVSGSCDGVIMSGVPHAEMTQHLLEIKTISKKRFDQLEKEGVEKSNPQYWIQVHCYMHGTGMSRCLFVAVCKDDDRIYTERIKYDKEIAEHFIQRGQRIATSDRMPPPPTYGADDWRMKFSDYYAVYYPKSAAAEHWSRLAAQRESVDPLLARICVNYRTDATSTPRDDGAWYSERWQAVIPDDQQHKADEGHVLHPDIMALAGWKLLDSGHEHIARYRLPDGGEVLNGDPRLATDEPIFTSNELLSNPSACAKLKDDKEFRAYRSEMGGRVTVSGGLK